MLHLLLPSIGFLSHLVPASFLLFCNQSTGGDFVFFLCGTEKHYMGRAFFLRIPGRMARVRGIGMVMIWVLLACACVWHPSFVNGDTDPNDASALNVLFVSLNSDSQLTGWKQNGGDPCGESWRGITCSGSAVTAIKLPGLRLNGTLGYNMNQMSSLTELDLSNNNLGNGVQIPYNIPTSLHRLDLSNNQFGQSLPYIISQMLSLEYLNVAHNRLQGNLGDMFGSLSNLVTLDLSFNSLNGNLPQSFSSLTSLTSLYLQNNQFTGHIDVLANLPLQNLNVENNQFTGWIPNQLQGINNLRIGNNQWSSGPAPPPPPYMPPPPSRKSNPGQESGGGGGGGIGGGGIAGIIISLLVVGGVIAFFVIKKKSRKHSTEESPEQDQPFAHLASESIKEMKTIRTPSVIDIEKLPPPTPVSLKPPPIDRYKSFDEDDFSNKPSTKKGNTASVKAVSYSVADLQMATDSFSEDNIVGEGSFGRVYKAQFSDGKLLAVKKLNSTALPTRSTDDFLELVISLSRLHHPNLTELVGYCSEYGQRLLVYDFHKNGSLYEQLQVTDEPLPWNARVKIALGTARALEYLHEVCSPSVVHKKLKSSNILLDAELNPHLSDCGLDKLVPNVDFQASEFNMGYTAPEVALSGQCTLKSDVYSFGVVMLELMTGRKPFDSSKPRSEQSLVLWATPQLHDIDALERMVDPGLKGLYPSKSLSRFADVIALCVQSEPEFRPPMSEVVQDLVRLVKRAKVNTRMPSDFGQETSRRGDDMDNYML